MITRWLRPWPKPDIIRRYNVLQQTILQPIIAKSTGGRIQCSFNLIGRSRGVIFIGGR